MFFFLSKFLWGLVAPTALLFIAVIVILGLSYKKQTNPVKRLSMTLAFILVILWIFPVGNWVFYAWERQYPPIELPKHVDGVIILGGAVDPYQTAAYGQPAFNARVERMTVVPELVKEYPNAKIIYSGGSGYLRRQDLKEADVAKEVFREWNMPLKRFIFERDSRNTYENAVYSKNLVKPTAKQQWLLVTSAAHMPRSKAIFDKQDWHIIPYPVDYVADKNPEIFCFCAEDNLGKIDAVVHEIVGYAAYKITGKAK